MSNNKNLQTAKSEKNDEFYTLIEDIETECKNYKKLFKGKVVYCNCDNPEWSNFWRYFHTHFTELGLKKLISTHYEENGKTYKKVYTFGDDEDINDGKETPLIGNGDFRSDECKKILEECDIVVTNPPFSLFRDFISTISKANKKFLVIGNQNGITYKEVFPLIRDNRMWLGCNHVKQFIQPNGDIKKFGNILWYTNLEHNKRHEPIELTKKFNPTEYPKYDNYLDGMLIKVTDIPMDDYIIVDIDESELEKWKSVYPDLEVLSDEDND